MDLGILGKVLVRLTKNTKLGRGKFSLFATESEGIAFGRRSHADLFRS